MSSAKLASIACIESMKDVFLQLVLIKILSDPSRNLKFHLPGSQ
jgi:hypothetical protein